MLRRRGAVVLMGTSVLPARVLSTSRGHENRQPFCHNLIMPTGAWPAERVPPATVEAVREELGPLVDDVLAAVRRENPVYAPVFEGSEGVALRLGVEQAVSSFLTAVQRGEHPGRDTAELWRRLGEAEFQGGRSLEALRGAFRTGIRAAWRGAAEVAVRAGLSPDMVISLAEAIFV